MRIIDCRGRACPQPVIETKKALEESGEDEIQVIVDNPASKENVRRFAESQGHRVTVSEAKEGILLGIQRRGSASGTAAAAQDRKVAFSGETVIFLDADSIGRGSEELGKVLIRSFFHTLGQSNLGFDKVIFVNSAVKLACEGSAVLEELRGLSQKNIQILCCGTCLDYFGLKGRLQIGRVSNMYEILASLSQAGKVIKI